MIINGEESILVNGKDYWFVDQFSRLTGKRESTIRVLINKGNTIRSLKTYSFGNKPLIEAQELFEFPFVVNGRQPNGMVCFTKYYINNDGVLCETKEECIDK